MTGWKPHDDANLEEVNASVIVVSDSLFAGTTEMSDDFSGQLAAEMLSDMGITKVHLDHYPDDASALKAEIEANVSEGYDIVLLIGGTGIAPRDVTVEAVEAILTKTLPGFGEYFRQKSYEEIAGRALLSRAIAGVRKSSLIVALPGSPNAVKLGINILHDFMPHALKLLKSD